MNERSIIVGNGIERARIAGASRGLAKALLLTGNLLIWPASQASAQEAAQAETQVGQLEEIVVTAQKREQSAQSTPIAITAI